MSRIPLNPADFEADMIAYIDAGEAFRKAAVLAYDEGARVMAFVVTCFANRIPLDVDTLLADCEGCKVLGERALVAETAFHDAAKQFFSWSDKFKGGAV